MAEDKDIAIEVRDDALLAVLQREQMDEDVTRRMREHVASQAATVQHLPVVLDLSKVELLPSLSLGALVDLLKELKGRQQRFMLVGVQPQVRESLALTRLDRLFEIYDSADEALARLREEV